MTMQTEPKFHAGEKVLLNGELWKVCRRRRATCTNLNDQNDTAGTNRFADYGPAFTRCDHGTYMLETWGIRSRVVFAHESEIAKAGGEL